MTVQGQLLEMLETVAQALGDELRNQLVFVGGCSTAVLITDEIILEQVRATDDVDLIVDLSGPAQWMRLQESLREKGFTVSSEDEVICRMRLGDLKVDFMPDDERILGFTNRWYAEGLRSATKYILPSGVEIKHLTAPLFIATKLEAYKGRGENDPLGSRDLEDVALVLDGREELVGEIKAAESAVRDFIADHFRALSKHPDFEHFLAGNIRGPEGRVELVYQRIEEIMAI